MLNARSPAVHQRALQPKHQARPMRVQPCRRRTVRPVAALDAETAAYVGLGAGAVSFLGTFLVAPRFKELFKEPIAWQEVYEELVKRNVQSISPQEAYARSRKGAVLLDIRLADKFNESAPVGAINVPLYRPIQNWDLASNIRRAGFAFFGIYGTELNPDFSSQLAAALPSKSKEVVVLCEMGGSLQKKQGAETGFQSRSLKAVYALQKAGYTKVTHMSGGFSEWVRSDLPTVEPGSGESEEEEMEEEEQPQAQLRVPVSVSRLFGRD